MTVLKNQSALIRMMAAKIDALDLKTASV